MFTGEHRVETHPLVFPNILRGPGHVAHFRIPMDDTHTRIMYILYNPSQDGSPVKQESVPYSYIGPIKEPYDDEGMLRQRHHMRTFASQDGMAWETQGVVTDRSREHLGVCDKGIIMLRKMLEQQIKAVEESRDPIGVLRPDGRPSGRQPRDVINFRVEQRDRQTGEMTPWRGQERRSFAKPVTTQ